MTANSAELIPGNNSNVIANDCSMQSFVDISSRHPRELEAEIQPEPKNSP